MVSNWNRKIEILAGTKGKNAKRNRALNQMNMTGNQWVRAQVDLGLMKPDGLRSLSDTPVFNPPLS